jgi:tetratricopeptide (TPR) repeat protein
MRIFLFVMVFLPSLLFAQGTDHQLAEHYFSEGEFDKALVYYERLYGQNDNKFYFDRYLACLEQTDNKKEIEKQLKKASSGGMDALEYTIKLAKFYELSGELEKSNKLYDDLVSNLKPISRDVIELYNAFKAQGKNDLAFQTLQNGRKLLKNTYPLNFQFADYYGAIGETEKMISEYLDLLDYHASYKSHLQRILSNQIDFTQEDSKEYELLKNALLERSQKNPSELIYAEMLTWLFIQRQNFAAALVQVKALDKRTASEGFMIFEFGHVCVENKDYATARNAFKTVIEIGEKSNYFVRAQNALLNVSFLEVTTLRNFSSEEIDEVIDSYKSVIGRYGASARTFPIIMELAHIEAFYGKQSDSALVRMSEMIEMPGLTDMQRAEAKMKLADINVLHGDVWEASLLYMQIDKAFKYEIIGNEAKFKNARIFYYDGEFDFAQSQLDVLKQATSKLISNDAIKLSLVITENYGLDSNYIAMNWFSRGDLLVEQHRYDEAFKLFDSIISEYPAHSLGDDIFLKKAYAMQLQGRWNEAIGYLEELLKYYSDDILADDALFQLGDIYENRLMNPEKALEYYRRILFDYKGSLYSDEVRKRFQKLRGQKSVNDDQEG